MYKQPHAHFNIYFYVLIAFSVWNRTSGSYKFLLEHLSTCYELQSEVPFHKVVISNKSRGTVVYTLGIKVEFFFFFGPLITNPNII